MIRGSSFKALFGGGSGTKPPKTTPTISPMMSPCRSPSSASARSPTSESGNSGRGHQFLQVGNTSSLFRMHKPQVKLLKKTASVKQLYNSVLHALKTIASTKDDITPELTKTFFENILRTSDDSPRLVVTKVKVNASNEFGKHFCSEVHAVDVAAKLKKGDSSEDEHREYHLIVKSQPQNEDVRNFLQPSHTFEKEVQVGIKSFKKLNSPRLCTHTQQGDSEC